MRKLLYMQFVISCLNFPKVLQDIRFSHAFGSQTEKSARVLDVKITAYFDTRRGGAHGARARRLLVEESPGTMEPFKLPMNMIFTFVLEGDKN